MPLLRADNGHCRVAEDGTTYGITLPMSAGSAGSTLPDHAPPSYGTSWVGVGTLATGATGISCTINSPSIPARAWPGMLQMNV